MQGVEILFEQVEFFLIAVIVIVLAYLALEHRDIVYAVFFFGIMASVVAGFFLLLEAPFIAGLQIAIYTGGITALIIFGVLLIPRTQDSSLEIIHDPRKRRIGLIMTGIVVLLSAALAFLFPWAESFPENRPEISQSLEDLAVWLWDTHGIFVQLLALIILVSLVGSIIILKMEKAEYLHPRKEEFAIPKDDTAPTKSTEGMPVIEAHDAEVADE